MRDDFRRPAACGAAGLADRDVAAGVIGMKVRVDDVPNRLVGQLLDRREQLLAHLRGAGIDDEHALVTDLDRDVAAGAEQHVDVALHREHVNLAVGGHLRLADLQAPLESGSDARPGLLGERGRGQRAEKAEDADDRRDGVGSFHPPDSFK